MKKINFVKVFVLGMLASIVVYITGAAVYNYGSVLQQNSPEVKQVITEVDSLPVKNVRITDLREVLDSTGEYKPVQLLYYDTDSTKRIIQLNVEKKWWKYHVRDYVVKH